MSGVLTANDASATLARALDATLELSDQYNFTACDVNGDGNITAVDAACILQKVLDNDYKFPVEETPVLYVVGDSTACHYGPNEDKALYVKRTGYGDKLSDYLTDEISVENLALSGRSSLSFTKEANYQTLLNNVKEGDYVLIGFGHNDEKAGDDERYTAPGGTKETEGTFKNSLYTNYILPVQEAGATPILITPIVRRTSSGTWSDAQLHKANGGDYAQDMVDLASELGISVVNATELTKNLYDTLTPDGTSLLHAWNGMTVSSVDNTHLNSYGASYVSYLVADAVKNSDSTLKNYVKDDISAPADVTIEDLVNPDYVEPDGSDPADLTSQLWTTTSPFYASAFGDIGGRAKLAATDESGEFTLPITFTTTKVNGEDVQNFAVTENSDGSVNLRVGSADSSAASFGKIASSSDGLFMYYTPFDAAGNFEISGTVTVNGYFKNNQVAFGAIISDNMAIDAYEAKSYQYVAAGGFKLADVGASIKDADGNVTGTNSGVSTYARIDGSLNLGARNISEDIAPGTQLKVSIKKVGETFTATVGDVTETYTVPMSGDAYAGFFVSRNADITVSDIHYSTEVVE
jgi:lysophospholipase L1-like esterase